LACWINFASFLLCKKQAASRLVVRAASKQKKTTLELSSLSLSRCPLARKVIPASQLLDKLFILLACGINLASFLLRKKQAASRLVVRAASKQKKTTQSVVFFLFFVARTGIEPVFRP